MKKIIYLALVVSSFSSVYAQVKTNMNVKQNTITSQTPFIDASSAKGWNDTNNIGKGFVFPQTNLVELETLVAKPSGISTSYPNNLDGMIVYNTVSGTPAIGASETPNVTPGFYYYKNDSNDLQGGHWVRIGSGEANMKPNEPDYKSTAVATGAKFYTSATESKPVYRKMISLNFNGTYAKLPDNTFSANDVFVNAYLVNQATAEVVGSVKIKRDIEVNSVRGDYVFSSNGSLYTTLSGAHKLIVEYYGK